MIEKSWSLTATQAHPPTDTVVATNSYDRGCHLLVFVFQKYQEPTRSSNQSQREHSSSRNQTSRAGVERAHRRNQGQNSRPGCTQLQSWAHYGFFSPWIGSPSGESFASTHEGRALLPNRLYQSAVKIVWLPWYKLKEKSENKSAPWIQEAKAWKAARGRGSQRKG